MFIPAYTHRAKANKYPRAKLKALNHAEPVGKSVRGNLYFHVSAMGDMPEAYRTLAYQAMAISQKSPETDFNVVKVSRETNTVSLLDYAGFFEEPFPCLSRAITIDITNKTFRERTYKTSINPPVLHRKELLLPLWHSSRTVFGALTRSLDARGIRPDRPGLGFRNQWNEHLSSIGVNVSGHTLSGESNDGS